MTAGAIADLLHARPAGRGKWTAHCPAHRDHSPSLSIREGQDGRVLVHCFAGCTHTAILTKLGLAQADLFSGPPPTREQLAALEAERNAREIAHRTQRRWLMEPYDRERKWQAIAAALNLKMITTPEDRHLAKLFHEALDKARMWGAEAERREAHAQSEDTK